MSETLENLCKKAAELFEQEKFQEIIELLTDDVLDKYKDAELYAWLARAYSKFNDCQKIMHYAQKAIDANIDYFMGYFARGNAWDKRNYDKAITDYNKAIELNPNDTDSYNNKGLVWYYKGDYDKAISDYNKAIELKPDYARVYNNRGLVWNQKGDYNKAISDYNKAIELKPDYAMAYNNRGLVWYYKGDYDKAISDYDKAIELKPDYDDAYYSRGLSIKEQGLDFEACIKDFEEFLKLATEKEDYWAKLAKNYIEELSDKINYPELTVIDELISKIKKILLLTEGCITHYTGLSVIKTLIFNEENKFRISEGSFLNDTSEGTELFKFLKYQFFTSSSDGLVAETFAPKPFIGSFVAENKHDDLNLWRFYGKENGEEAKGCAITIKIKEFIEAINLSLNEDHKKLDASSEDDINFFRVAYWDHDIEKINFQIPHSKREDAEALNKLMKELKDKVASYEAEDKSVLEKYLNKIAFLFKSNVYKNENELRLVIKGIEFKKISNIDESPPRPYIELVNIRNLIEQITLGPKVDKPDEWASSIYHNYDNKKPPKILISRLPYK